MLVSYPLGSAFVRMPSGHASSKHLFNVAVTAFYLLGMMKLYTGALQLLGSILFTYYTARSVKGHSMPWIVFVYVFVPGRFTSGC